MSLDFFKIKIQDRHSSGNIPDITVSEQRTEIGKQIKPE